MVCVLVVHMLILVLVSSMAFSAYRMHVSKTCIFLRSHAPSEYLPRSLQNVLCKLLIFNHTQLEPKNESTSQFFAHFFDVRQNVFHFVPIWQDHLNKFFPRHQCHYLVWHLIGQGHYNGRECGCGL